MDKMIVDMIIIRITEMKNMKDMIITLIKNTYKSIWTKSTHNHKHKITITTDKNISSIIIMPNRANIKISNSIPQTIHKKVLYLFITILLIFIVIKLS